MPIKFRVDFNRFLLISGASAFIFFVGLWLFLTVESFPGHEDLRVFLIKRLTRIEPFHDITYTSNSKSDNILYVLGGWQGSLKKKFETASDLYHRGLGRKILLLHMPGITEYNPLLDRNLTNDEWAVKKIVALGVKKEDIELLALEEGFFGTFAEAQGISDIASKRGYKHLILVTSQYHTLRTWVTFSELLEDRGITLNIYATNETVGLSALLLEYLKLFLYENIVLPVYVD